MSPFLGNHVRILDREVARRFDERCLCNVRTSQSIQNYIILTFAIRQGFGNLGAALVSFVCVVAFKDSLIRISEPSKCDARCQMAADKMWRTIVAFGALPAILALYFRLTIPETPRYTMDVTMDIEKAKADTDAYLAGKRAGGHVFSVPKRVYLPSSLGCLPS